MNYPVNSSQFETFPKWPFELPQLSRQQSEENTNFTFDNSKLDEQNEFNKKWNKKCKFDGACEMKIGDFL